MSLEDGEYELDISVLLQNASTSDTHSSSSSDNGNHDNNENIAIRYGFIPDSMDQSKPLKLYQRDQTCILKAASTEGPNKPIFFEGIPQRYHRNSTNGSSSSSSSSSNSSNNDSFYLTFGGEGTGNVVHLKKLESTIRFNKSRNAVKIQKQVNEWEKEYERRPVSKNSKLKNGGNGKSGSLSLHSSIDEPMTLHLPNISSSRSTPPIRSTPTTSPLRKPPSMKKSTNKSSATSSGKTLTAVPARKVSSKRPPVSSISTPEIKPELNTEPIISESDFEDLEMEDTKLNDFPVIEFESDDEPKPKPKPKTAAKKPTKPKTTKPKKQTKSKKSTTSDNPDKSMELDDEFKDLEDQLQEVLEEDVPVEESPAPSSIKNSPAIEVTLKNDSLVDSDESDFEDFHFTGIKIDEGNNGNGSNDNKAAFNLKGTSTNGKPRSLRDLVGGGNTPSLDDDSSSEEE
ncbi:hypothetical protein Cantr_09734 [Candida viswanathii]|uniref:Transcription elongation factor Eaf N-terminal domain-containing protein n=1 Tax=Candida viswanathii TaxID=5486 RepID=A0A367YBT4_9ASCO|nr:hypothetical protein Cantr_09734 [Candida viswanathii]